jgi:dihydrofolate synthase/folylpolyglutamate synthase
VSRDFLYAAEEHDLEGQTFRVWRKGQPPARLRIPLLGLHQVENAATAYAALQVTVEQGLKISPEAIREGFSSVVWPGRFEILRAEPPVIVDSAHNRDSAHRLRQALDDYLPGRKVILIFGASEDKDIEGMFEALMPRTNAVVATQSIHPRALEVEKIVSLAQQHGCSGTAALPVEAALAIALEMAGDHSVVLAAGSLFIAAAVREIWQRRFQPGVEGKARAVS